MIDSYTFGQMVIKGKSYTKDLIIYPDRVKSPWWRKTGHLLTLSDIDDVIAKNPETLIIGTGYIGLMKVDEDVKKFAKDHEIDLIIQKSKQAAKTYNERHSKEIVFAAFHLTC
jgi:hypothetical protein